MKLKDIRTWTKALRSGDYKQGRQALQQIGESDQCRFCCLGVAIDVLLEGDWDYHKRGQAWRFDDQLSFPSSKTLIQLGLNQSTASQLASKNDNGHSFDEIADWIEINTDQLLLEDGNGE